MKTQRWVLFLLLSILISSLCAPSQSSAAASVTIKPRSIVNLKGKSAGKATSLAMKDQAGTADQPARYVAFTTPNVAYSGYRVFQVPDSVSLTGLSAFKISVNYKGPAYAAQHWSWWLYDWTRQTWVVVGNNQSAKANVWSALTFQPTNVRRFISSGGQIRLQLKSSNASGNAKIDYEAITLVYAASTIRFAVIGDFGIAGTPESDVADLVKSWNPDFIITTGDNNYPDGTASTIDKNIGQYYHDYIYPYTGIYGAGATTNRFFPILGNHDWHTTNAQKLPSPYLDYFKLPNNERYYTFANGPVRFFALDSVAGEPDGTSSTSKQALWLKNIMASTTEPWKIVYLHYAPYSSGAMHGSNKGVQWPFLTWGADAVMSGHEHNYERVMVGGIPYFVNGVGGAVLYTGWSTPVAGSKVRYNSDYGAMLVEATSTSITYQFINRAGTVIDTYTDNTP